jgi:hypothetical protein
MTGLKTVPASQGGVFTVMLPVSAALVGVLVLGETLGPGTARSLCGGTRWRPVGNPASTPKKLSAGAALVPHSRDVHEAIGRDGRTNGYPSRQHLHVFRGKTHRVLSLKKQHARVKKACFRLETRFFSSSIRFASGEAVFHW